LRVLQEGSFEPLGTNSPVRVDVRIVSATHRDLKQCVAAGTFREDLYYRLNVLDVRVPPLRLRKGDLPLLVEHFLERFSGDSAGTVSPAAWETLSGYAFPGNVRELEHAIQHAVVLARGNEIRRQHLPYDVTGPLAEGAIEPESEAFVPLSEAVGSFERSYLIRALKRTEGKKSRAAGLLCISRKNLWEKLKGYGVRDDEFAV